MGSREEKLMRNTSICKRALLIFLLVSPMCIIDFNAEAQVAAQSGYSLIGTIQSGDLTGAVIAITKSEQSFFRKFEKLPDGSQIVEVRPDSVVVKRDDGTAYEMFVLHETKTVASAQPVQPVQTIQPNIQGDPYASGITRSATGERPLSSFEKRRGRRKTDRDNE